MKTLIKMSFLIFIPFFGGLICQIIGGSIENEVLAYVGYLLMAAGTPVVAFGIVVIGLILIITERINLSDRSAKGAAKFEEQTENKVEEQTENIGQKQAEYREQEQAEYAKIADVNTSYGRESQYKNAEYIGGHAANVYKNSSKKEKILGWLFFAFLMIDFFLIMVFMFFRITVGIIVCFCVFVGTILISIIVKLILQRLSMKFNPVKVKEYLDGEVKVCLLSSSTNVGGGSRRATTRITGVVYRVVIVANGEEYNAYTDKFYQTGDSVYIAVLGKHLASIIENH